MPASDRATRSDNQQTALQGVQRSHSRMARRDHHPQRARTKTKRQTDKATHTTKRPSHGTAATAPTNQTMNKTGHSEKDTLFTLRGIMRVHKKYPDIQTDRTQAFTQQRESKATNSTAAHPEDRRATAESTTAGTSRRHARLVARKHQLHIGILHIHGNKAHTQEHQLGTARTQRKR